MRGMNMSFMKFGLFKASSVLGLAAAVLSAHGLGGKFLDATILIDKAVGSPTLTVRYNGATASMAELIINGESFGTRSLSDRSSSGETNFNINLYSLREGDNDVEIRLFDKNGRLVATQKSTIQAENPEKPTVFITAPRMGATVEGPIEIKVGFGRELKNIYVSFFVDNQVRTFINQPPYTFMWDTMRERNGWHEVEAWIADEAGSTYKTKKLKVFVQNAGGRTNRRTIQAPAVTNSGLAEAAKAASVVPTVATTSAAMTKTSKITKAIKTKAVKSKKVIAPTVTKRDEVALSALSANERVEFVGTGMSVRPTQADSSVMMGDKLMTPTGKRKLVASNASMAPRPIKLTTPLNKVQEVSTSGSAAMSTKLSKPSSKIQELEIKTSAKPVELAPATNGDAVKLNGATLMNRVSALPASQPAVKDPNSATPTAVTTGVKAPIGKPASKVEPKVEQPATMTKAAIVPGKVVMKAATSTPAPRASTLVKVAKGTKIPEIGTFSVVMDGAVVEFDVQPHFTDGVPVSPVRHIIEKKGGKVSWDNNLKQVHAIAFKKDVIIQIGAKIASIDGVDLNMELPASIEMGRTIVPLSFLREAFGINVEYDKETRHILITTVKK